MENEVWKDIKGFEGRYQVSNMGRVRYPDTWVTRSYPNGNTASYRTRKGAIKKFILNRYGYSVVMTQKDCKDKETIPVCKLVASCFGEGYEDGMQIIHIDGDISNNRIDNLSFNWMEDLPGEQWKPIKNFEGLYEVSNMGRFRSVYKYKNTIARNGTPAIVPVRPKLLYLNKVRRGYYHVILYKESKRYEYSAHRLVALHFCEGYKRGYVVNHKDEDPSNNRADNLEWCTDLYNRRYGTAIQRAAESNWKKVAQYDLSGNLVATYNSAKEAAKVTGCNYISLCGWCRGAHTPKNDYRWAYI
jgi:hypothetical protein